MRVHEFIVENTLSRIINSVVSRIKGLTFGQKARIKVPNPVKENFDVKSHMGYYAEVVTAYNIAKKLEKSGARLSSRSSSSGFQNLMNQKLEFFQSQDNAVQAKLKDELPRNTLAGETLGNSIVNDIITNGEDYNLLEFDIELTGDSGKGTTKADIVLSVTKMDTNEVIDRILASLKASKAAKFNLDNATLISLIKKLFYDKSESLPKGGFEFTEKFVEDFGSKDEIQELLSLQNLIKTEMDKNEKNIKDPRELKAYSRALAKESHGRIIDLIVEIFNTHYPQNKAKINHRVLDILGLDGADDFYAAVGTTKQKAISSRVSKDFKILVENLKKDFTLTIERNGTTKQANINLLSPENDLLLQGQLTFTDTGGKNPQAKTNAFMDFKKFLS